MVLQLQELIGTLVVGANGTYTYVADQSAADDLDAGDTATDTFTYTISDGDATDTATLIITVTGVNDAPVAVNDTDSVNEDATVTQSSGSSLLMADDSDADDDDSFTVTHIGTGTDSDQTVASSSTYNSNGTSITGTLGTLVVGANGTYTYVADQSAADDLDAGDTATDTFTYTISDGDATDTATLIITVTGVNDAPVAVNDTDSVNEDATVTQSSGSSLLMADDSDADDDDSFTVTHIGTGTDSDQTVASSSTYNSNGTSITGTLGTLVVGANGTYTYVADQSAADDLDAGDTATDTFTYTISDGDATDTATLIITVTGVNDAPVAVNDTDSVNEDATVTQSSGSSLLMADDSDADDDDSFTVTHIGTGTDSDQTVASSSTYNSNGTSITGTLGTLVVGANGTYTYVADQSAADDLDAGDTATDTFTYTISDGDATDTATLIITVTGVNDAPTAADKTVTTNEDTAYVFSTSDFGYTDVDDDDALVSVKITELEDAGALQYYNGSAWVDVTLNQVITATDIAANKLRFNPAANENGSSYTTFNFTVNDGDADSATPNTITVNVSAGNNAPSATNDTDAVNEDATITESSGSELLVADDSDADSDTLTVTQIAVTGGSNSAVSSGTTHSNGTSITGTYGTLVVGANGSYTYVADQSAADDLDAGDTATDSFTYTVSDGTATDTATLIITVTGVNDAPVAVNDTDSVNEDATVTQSSGSSLLMADDSDADDDDSFTVTHIGTGTDSDQTVASSSTYNSNGTSITGTLGTLVVGANGTYTYVADQSAADDLDAGDTATDTFTYTISDGDATDTATLIITVTGVNDAPVAVNDTDSVNEDATVTQSSGSSLLMADDSDADDDDSFTVTHIGTGTDSDQTVASSSTYNSNGTSITGTLGTLVVGANGTYTYVADQSAADDLDAGDTATDTFTYTISDGDATDTATLIITVTGVNDVPTAADKTVTTNEDTAYVFSTSDFGYTDVDDDDALVSVKITELEDAGALQYYNGSAWVDVTLNQVITATDIAANKLRFNPAANENGSSYTTFNFTVNDGDADSATPNTITVNVTAVNDAPVAENDTDSVNEDSSVTKTGAQDDVLNDDSDADSDTLTVTLIGTGTDSDQAVASSSTYNSGTPTTVTGTYGQLTIGADGSYIYTANQDAADDLDAGDTATDSFTYTVSDGTNTDTATLIITVTGVNDVPTAADNTVTTTEDTPYVFSTTDFGYTDSDDNDSLVSVKITTLEDDGALQYYNGTAWVDVTLNQVITATDISNGLLRLNPDANDNDSPYTTFAFTVNDGDADSSTPNTMTINVTAANDDPVADNESNTVTEGNTLTVTDGSSDLLDGDNDVDGDSLTISGIRTGRESGSGTSGTVGNELTGTYGTLKLNSDGTYTYTPNDILGAGDTGRDYFTYTVSDGNGGTDTAELLIVVTGANDAPVAVNDTNTINISKDSTLRATNNSVKDILTNDTDSDSGDSKTVTGIRTGATEGSGTAGTIGDELTGTYGTLTMNANGSYTYEVNED